MYADLEVENSKAEVGCQKIQKSEVGNPLRAFVVLASCHAKDLRRVQSMQTIFLQICLRIAMASPRF